MTFRHGASPGDDFVTPIYRKAKGDGGPMSDVLRATISRSRTPLDGHGEIEYCRLNRHPTDQSYALFCDTKKP